MTGTRGIDYGSVIGSRRRAGEAQVIFGSISKIE
jgi:hypothetical protein